MARACTRWVVLVALVAAACSDDAAAPPDVEPASAYAPGWSAVHADSSNTDYSPLEGAADVTLAWHRDFEGSDEKVKAGFCIARDAVAPYIA